MIVMQAEDNERREKNLEEAKKITIENDPSLPKPDTVRFWLFFLIIYFYTSRRDGREKNVLGVCQKKPQNNSVCTWMLCF